jgi:hypothetical protein
MALGEKILTLENPRKRHVIVVDWRCICKKSGKTIDQLLLHCEVTTELWVLILHLFGVEWVMSRTMVKLLVGEVSWEAVAF